MGFLLVKLRLTCLLLLAACSSLEANEQTQQFPCSHVSERPCVALVLGGGGARGGAHIGVLKALEQQGIKIDVIVGTSIGSFVGGLYASGLSATEIEQLFSQADWNTGYKDDLNRSELPNRRKQHIDDFPIQLDLGFDGKQLKLPRGIIQGQGMKKLLDEMLGIYPIFGSFDDLTIPFRAIAADAQTGEQVILSQGDLSKAIQSSMSIPGLLRPIELNDQLLVDGGVANNLPISVAKELGADIVIAVDIGSATLNKDELNSSLSIIMQLTGFLVTKNVNQQKKLLTSNDIYIKPTLNDVEMLDFEKVTSIITEGYQSAITALADSTVSKQLANTAEPVERKTVTLFEQPVNSVKITNNSRLNDDYIAERFGVKPGEKTSLNAIQQGIDRLYGQGTLVRVNTAIEQQEDKLDIDLEVEEKEWGPGYLDFKLSFEDTFETFSEYQIGAAYRYTNLSPYGAQWYTKAIIGTEKELSSELYWPINTSGFYWQVGGSFQREIFSYYIDNIILGELTDSHTDFSTGIGWDKFDKLNILFGPMYSEGTLKLPGVFDNQTDKDRLDYRQYGAVFELNYDSFDHASFPRSGNRLDAKIEYLNYDILEQSSFSTNLGIEYNTVYSIGYHSLRGLFRYQSILDSDPTALVGLSSLGGFLNLSGNPLDTISGQHVRFMSVIYTYELVSNNFGAINLPLYLGTSLEAGNAWQTESDIDYSDLIYSNSVFLGWDSPIGPAYLAYGQSTTGDESFYLFLGIPF